MPASGQPEVKHEIPESGDIPLLWYTDAQLRRVGERIAFGGQRWQNHLGCHCMGLLCAGYALGDAATVRFALDHEDNPHDFKSLLAGAILMPGDRDRHGVDPGAIQPGEIYDRYRTSQGKGLIYSFLHLRFLLNAAEIALRNGRDFYDYTAPGGENLLLPFRFLGKTLLDGPEALEGTYYEIHEGERARIAAGLTRHWYPNLFLGGRRRHPDDPIIAEVCRRADTGIFVRSGAALVVPKLVDRPVAGMLPGPPGAHRHILPPRPFDPS